ncbi:MAG: hypothetical protein DHS20C17_11230 [Cyclobacteriaceae bacterium]|nr:MAG: hypothetical protein DHS20C17_11230 [Cyclobacteriaceae bacterium]
MKNKSVVKQQILDSCKQVISDRISVIENNLEAVRESRNNETKSSAGDKYETSRAMLQIEEDNYQKQLHQAMLLKNQLEQINVTSQSVQADQGSLVVTNQGSYFISIGLGKITLENGSYFCISSGSPMGQKLTNQQVGFKFSFNGQHFEIMEVQ